MRCATASLASPRVRVSTAARAAAAAVSRAGRMPRMEAQGADAHFRVRRLVRQRQDDADRAGRSRGSSRAGLSVSLIKHAHHRFDVDQPGKDSYRHRHAGCSEVLVTSGDALGADARAARRARTVARRGARAAVALRPRAGRRLQGVADPEARGLARRGRQAAAASRRIRTSSPSRPTAPTALPAGAAGTPAGARVSTTMTPSQHSSRATRAVWSRSPIDLAYAGEYLETDAEFALPNRADAAWDATGHIGLWAGHGRIRSSESRGRTSVIMKIQTIASVISILLALGARRPGAGGRRAPMRLGPTGFYGGVSHARQRAERRRRQLRRRRARRWSRTVATAVADDIGVARAGVRRLPLAQRHRRRGVVQLGRPVRAAAARRAGRAARRRTAVSARPGLGDAADPQLECRRLHELDVLPCVRALRSPRLRAGRDAAVARRVAAVPVDAARGCATA